MKPATIKKIVTGLNTKPAFILLALLYLNFSVFISGFHHHHDEGSDEGATTHSHVLSGVDGSKDLHFPAFEEEPADHSHGNASIVQHKVIQRNNPELASPVTRVHYSSNDISLNTPKTATAGQPGPEPPRLLTRAVHYSGNTSPPAEA